MLGHMAQGVECELGPTGHPQWAACTGIHGVALGKPRGERQPCPSVLLLVRPATKSKGRLANLPTQASPQGQGRPAVGWGLQCFQSLVAISMSPSQGSTRKERPWKLILGLAGVRRGQASRSNAEIRFLLGPKNKQPGKQILVSLLGCPHHQPSPPCDPESHVNASTSVSITLHHFCVSQLSIGSTHTQPMPVD